MTQQLFPPQPVAHSPLFLIFSFLQSKAFEHVVRFSDFREKLLGILQNVTCGEDVMNDTMDTSVDMDKSKGNG